MNPVENIIPCLKEPLEMTTSTLQSENVDNNQDVNHLLILSSIDLTTTTYHSITKLDLFQCNLSKLPPSLPTTLPNLSILFCMKNKFTTMPSIIGSCQNLQMVSFKSNSIKWIEPDALQKQLRWLILTDNLLECIPSSIGNCSILQKLMLSGNQLVDLPEEISKCTSLELIRLASNKLTKPPTALLSLLPNLAWIALSDNPFLTNHQTHQNISSMEQSQLQIFPHDYLDDPTKGIVLGKGASGITRQYELILDNAASNTTNNPNSSKNVAVKEYFHSITSDGNPEEERNISLIISQLDCPSFIKVIGQTKKGNLIMELLTNYTVLAGPPTFNTCSRDVYDEKTGVWMNGSKAIGIVDKLLFSLMKLHACGICHGDFYGHNILISSVEQDWGNEDNQQDYSYVSKCRNSGSGVWLTDFGASFFYDRDSSFGKSIERIERRAFMHLVMEIRELLINKKVTSSNDSTVIDVLFELAKSCENLEFSALYRFWQTLLNINTL